MWTSWQTVKKSTTTEVTRRVRGQQEPEIINKPDMILSYNKYIGGGGVVDTSDMMLYTYLDERKRWNTGKNFEQLETNDTVELYATNNWWKW